MNRFLGAVLIALLALPAFAGESTINEARELSDYVTRGFRTEDARLSAYFALTPLQRAGALLLPSPRGERCTWDEPFLLVHRAAPNEADGRHYETVTLTPFFEWMAWMDRPATRTYETGDPEQPFVMIRWTGSFCVGLP